MFRHLRNRLILINLAVTTVVLVVSFSSIYAVAQAEAQRRQEITASIILPGYNTQVVSQTFNERIKTERKAALRSLLVSLIIVGLLEEVAVAILSYIMAETAIRPVREAYEAQKNFIANASHEMKTPITAIMANLEVADIKDNPWIDNVTQEVKLMEVLNRELLALARAENAITATNASETVILREAVESLISPFRPRLQQKKIDLVLKTQLKDGKVKIAKGAFSQIFTILLDNAVKYCDKSITIHLSSRSVSITNDGATISPDALSHIFDRFYQTDKSSEGVGLGLAIAKSLADRQNWKLTAKSDSGQTTFTLDF